MPNRQPQSLLVCLVFLSQCACSAEPAGRGTVWVDPYRGEPVTYEEVVDDLASVRIVYLGEAHSLDRHHKMQAAILRDLAARGKSLVLGLEQL